MNIFKADPMSNIPQRALLAFQGYKRDAKVPLDSMASVPSMEFRISMGVHMQDLRNFQPGNLSR